MSISHFASEVNLSLCEYIDKIPFEKAAKQKKPIHFLKGDPVAYGNDNFRMPQAGYDIIKKQIEVPTNHGYTLSSGVPTAREAILKLYKPKFQVTINQVLIQHGVNQSLLATLMSFTNPGDQILVPQTGYPIFQKLAPALKVTPISYKLRWDKKCEIDLQHVKTLITQKTQFIFIINPSNPMGTVYSKEHMEQVLKFCDENQLPIVADEVYYKQSFPGIQHHSFGDLTENVPVIVLCGIQKILSVSGWCTSWAILFDKNKYLESVWRNMGTSGMIFLHSNKFTQMALPELIQKLGIFTSSKYQTVKKNHDFLVSQFSKMKGYQPIEADGTIYLTEIKNDIEFMDKLTEQENIIMLPLSIFGGNIHGFRVITCGNKDIYQDLLKRLADFNERHCNK